MDRRRGREALPGRRRRRDRRRGRARRSVADRRGDGAARHHAVRPRHDVHDRGGRDATRTSSPRTCRWTTRASIPCRVAARRSRPPSRWRARITWRAATTSARRSSPAGARTTATRSARWTRAGRSPSASRTPRGSAGSSTRRAAYEYRCGNPEHPDGCGEWHGAELERMISLAGAETVAAFIAEPVGGATLAGAVPDRRLLAGDRGRLPAVRHPGDRGRGHDRVRQDRTLVRRRPLGRPPRHPHRRQGDHERLRAVRVRGGERRRLRHGRVRRVRARVHVVAQRARRGRGERGPAPPVERRVDRAERRPGRAAPEGSRASRSTAPRPSATCAGWA